VSECVRMSEVTTATRSRDSAQPIRISFIQTSDILTHSYIFKLIVNLLIIYSDLNRNNFFNTQMLNEGDLIETIVDFGPLSHTSNHLRVDL